MLGRAVVFLVLSTTVYSQNTEEALEALFTENLNPNRTTDNLKCSAIQGEISGCYNCFLCDHSQVNRHAVQDDPIERLRLIDGNCDSTQVCCVSHNDLNEHRTSDKCGEWYPEGMPRRVRPSLRAVLQGEYPWRAWIYNTKTSSQLCAATYINSNSKSLLTSASCLYGSVAENLSVRFDRNKTQQSLVERVIVHPQYELGKSKNDIAVVILRNKESVPQWAREACCPLAAPPSSTACVIASTEDNLIQSVIPQQSRCSDPPLDNSLLCAKTPYKDYVPEYGGGLFCMDEWGTGNQQQFRVFGIMLEHHDSLNLFTNIGHHLQWLKTNKIIS